MQHSQLAMTNDIDFGNAD